MDRYVETKHVLVDVKDVSKSYGDHVVLSGVNLQVCNLQLMDEKVQQSQIVTICGPSGAGKTTLFNCMAGLESTDSGTIFIDNPATLPTPGLATEDLVPTAQGLVGVVYQDYRLFPFNTVQKLCEMVFNESSMIGKKVPGRKEQLEIIALFLNHFGLTEHANKYPELLSGGQKQRVAIVQQLLREPQLLLMDEPFSGLDPETKARLIERLTSIAKLNDLLTVVIISHDIGSALMVSDTVYFMGRNRDPEGNLTAGSSILHQHTIDLKKLGLAWHNNDPAKLRELAHIELQVNDLFPILSGKK